MKTIRKITFQTSFDPSKLTALEMELQRKNSNLDTELSAYLEQLYLRKVPAAIRKYHADLEAYKANSNG